LFHQRGKHTKPGEKKSTAGSGPLPTKKAGTCEGKEIGEDAQGWYSTRRVYLAITAFLLFITSVLLFNSLSAR
jgi:hypothetical protein